MLDHFDLHAVGRDRRPPLTRSNELDACRNRGRASRIDPLKRDSMIRRSGHKTQTGIGPREETDPLRFDRLSKSALKTAKHIADFRE